MAITYHAGRRIQGLSTDGELTPTKTIDFTSCNSGLPSGWVGANQSGYGTAGQGFACDTETLKVTSNTANIHTNVTYDLNTNDGITVGSKWVLTWTSIITSYSANTNAGAQHSVYFGMTDSATVGEPAGSTEEAAVRFTPRSDLQAYQVAWIDNTSYNFSGNIASLGVHTKYHKLVYERGGTVTHYIYNNSDYSDTPVTGSTSTNSHTNALNKIKFSQYVESNNGTLIMKIDDVKFYNGVTSTTGVKPTNVQSGSRFEETDTRKIYYGANPLIFEDDFTSYSNKTEGDAVWVSEDTSKSYVDSVNDHLRINQPYSTSVHAYVAKDLGTNVSNTAWVCRYKLNFITWNISAELHLTLHEADQTVANNATGYNVAGIRFSAQSTPDKIYVIATSSGSDRSAVGSGSSFTVSTGTDYFVEMIRDGDDFTITVRTGSHSGTTSATATETVSGIDSLRYFKISNVDWDFTTSNGDFITTLDDFEFYNGVTSPTNLVWTEEA